MPQSKCRNCTDLICIGGIIIKRYIGIIVIIAGLLLSGCGAIPQAVSTTPSPSVTASQSSFLADMAEGIETRNNNIDDPENDPPIEELAAYYKKLVSCELNRIEKYDNAIFENTKFNQLAHSYIDACKIQLTATDNYRSEDLLHALWDGGREIRAQLIVEFYEKYELPLSSELVNTYRIDKSSDTTNVSVSVDKTRDDIRGLLDLDPNEVPLKKGDLRIIDCNVKLRDNPKFGGEYEIEYTVRNESDYPVEIGLQLYMQDRDGNNLGSYYLYSGVEVPAGKIKTLSSYNALDEGTFRLIPYDFLFDGNRAIYKHLRIVDEDITQYTLVFD